MSPHFLEGNNCVTTCNGAFFGHTGTNQCKACGDNCEACTSDTDCDTCAAGYLMLDDISCTDVCPTNSLEDAGSTICTSCHEGCEDCSLKYSNYPTDMTTEANTALDTDFCVTCESGYYLRAKEDGDGVHEQCVTECPDG